ncbi:C40 family peptidase [Sphaerimonospora sp. CA-214678]|uniref:C40 family peptidase n=1 Tax=Sphaerimonospora sp. CA-214678 TaxID=3240029 RepID=UPI003D903CD9
MLTSSLGAFAAPASADDTVTVTVTEATPAEAGRAASAGDPAANKTSEKANTEKKEAEPSRAARQRSKARKAVKVAKRHIGAPYRWGATGPRAFDCSGLVQFAWRKAGVRLPRTTWSMRSAVRKKVAWRNLKAGDLVFTSGGGHVGMYIGRGRIVHAPHSGTRVRIDKLDSYRKRTFVGAVRPGV